jgi:putative PEP-CTERM system TPR-repeat lipoprotein
LQINTAAEHSSADLIRMENTNTNLREIMSSITNKQKISIAVTSAMIILSSGLTACSKSNSVEKLVGEAKQYRQKGDNKAAIIQLKNALEKKPDDAEVRALLGSVYLDTGDAISAEKEIRKAMSLGMSADKETADLGKALLMQGQYQKALDAVAPVAGAKSDAAVLTLRGSAYLALGKTAEAKDAFEAVLKDKPNDASALIGLARYAILQKDNAAAMSYVDQAVTKNPGNVEVLLFKGDLLRAQGQLEPALAAYGDVLKVKPDHVSALLDKANLEIGAGKFDTAKADLDNARKAAPKSLRVLYTQALLDFRQEKNSAALESVQQILRAAPDDMPTNLLAGAVENTLGSTQQAEQHLKKYLAKNPDHLYARKLLASVLIKQGQFQSALDALAPALKTSQPESQVLALAGECYMQLKDYTKATEYFEKASALAPQSAPLHTSLGLSRLGQGDNARGIAELETAASLDSKSTKAGTMLVMTHLRLKEYDKAMAAVVTLEKQEPNNPLFQNMKGNIYLGKKDTKNARASFEKALALQPTYYPAAASLAQLDMQDKKPEDAKKRFESILEKDKKNDAALTALAALALSQGKKEEATALLERASNENPDAIPPALRLIDHYIHLGEKLKALTLARKLQVTNSSNADLLDRLAQAQLLNDDKAGALETYGKVAVLLPDSAVVQYRIGAIQATMKNTAGASESLKKALALQPNYLDALTAQITLEVAQGNFTQAITMARQVQKQHQKSPIGFVMEGDVLMAQKNPQAAVKAYEQAYALNKNGALIIKLHDAMKQAGKGKEADSRLTQWLKDHPADITVRSYLASVYLAANQNKAAIDQYQAILHVDPVNVAALNNLAWAYQQEKDPRALEAAEKAYQLAPNSPAVWDTLGWVLVTKGNTARGLPLLEKAAGQVPTALDIRYHFAQALIKTGDKTKARRELEQIVAAGKSFSKFEEAQTLLKQL